MFKLLESGDWMIDDVVRKSALQSESYEIQGSELWGLET